MLLPREVKKGEGKRRAEERVEKLWVLSTAFGKRILGGVIKKKKKSPETLPSPCASQVAGTIHTD